MPCAEAICPSVSPLFTVYVLPPLPAFELPLPLLLPEFELPPLLPELPPVASLLTINLSPGKISVDVKLFHFIKFDNDMPCADAILLNESPLLTVYVLAFPLLSFFAGGFGLDETFPLLSICKT